MIVDRERWPTVESTVLTVADRRFSGGITFLWTGRFYALAVCLRLNAYGYHPRGVVAVLHGASGVSIVILKAPERFLP